MSQYNFDDILVFAVNIEKNGEHFYREFAKKSESSEVASLFVFLADEEVKHAEFFSDILRSVKDFSDIVVYNDDYFSYLRAFVDNAVFDHEKNNKLLAAIESVSDALDFALKMETDSIMFYSELKTLVKDGEKIGVIIDEEKKHFRKLYDLKQNYIKG